MTFGSGDGIVTTNLSSTSVQTGDVAVQPDGKIVVVGNSYGDFVVARYSANGSPDTSFCGDGILQASFQTNYNDEAESVAIQTDGKIVVAGKTVSASGNSYFALARLNSTGTFDTSFDGNGVKLIYLDNFIAARSVAVQSDGKIVAAGVSNISSDSEPAKFAVVRLNANGTYDTSFDADGRVTTGVGDDGAFGYHVELLSDGRIAVSGTSYTLQETVYVPTCTLVRYNATGSLDFSLDGDGKLVDQAFPGSCSLALQMDGKTILVGYGENGLDKDFAVNRYNPDGSADATFSADGKLLTNLGKSSDQPKAAAV